MPVWQTVRLLREASLNKHQRILKHFMQHIVFFPVIRYRQIFCHFKTSSYLKNTWAGKAIPQETCPRFPRPSSEQQRLVAFSLLPRSCRTEFLGRFSLPRVGPGKDRRQDWTGGRRVRLPSTSNPRANTRLLRYIPQNSEGDPQKSLGSSVFLVKYCTVLATSAKTFDLKSGVHLRLAFFVFCLRHRIKRTK